MKFKLQNFYAGKLNETSHVTSHRIRLWVGYNFHYIMDIAAYIVVIATLNWATDKLVYVW